VCGGGTSRAALLWKRWDESSRWPGRDMRHAGVRRGGDEPSE
jgi:hypothetical protein